MANIVADSKKSFAKAKAYWEDIYKEAKADARFQSGSPYSQWDDSLLKARKDAGLPVLQIDQLNQFVHQVVNDIKMNTPSIDVIPSKGSDKETAEIYRGLIRDIEYKSKADNAYDMAVNNAVKTSLGFFRIDHDYEGDEGEEQVLCIKRVPNQFSCYLDCCIEPDGSDAMEGWVLETITTDEFKKRFPNKEPVSFMDERSEVKETGDVTIAEYFQIEESEYEVEGSKRKLKKRTVNRYILSGRDELEKSVFPGIYIPIIPVFGEEAWIDGKREIYSLIRRSKGAQQAHNLWHSLTADSLMKQTGAKWQAADGQTEDFVEDYQSPHKTAVLRYYPKDSEGNTVGPPLPIAPPPPPMGYMEALIQSVDHIRATVGIYGAGIGDRTNEVSGVAIDSRKLESDTSTYHFGDNLIKSLTHAGKILVHAIPEIYDTARIISVVDDEDQYKTVGVNGMMLEGQEREYDLRSGKFDVRVTTGTSYATKRQATATFYEKVLTRMPQLFDVAGDLIFEYSDVEGADQLAKRMKKVIDPKFLDEEQDPMVGQLQAQVQEAQAIIAELQAQIEDKNREAQIKIESERLKAEIEFMRLQQQERESLSDTQLKQMEMELKAKELQLKEIELQIKATEAQNDIEIANINAQKDIEVARSLPKDDGNMAVALQGITQAISKQSGPKRIIRNNQGLIEGIE